jgi:hypothetical protein
MVLHLDALALALLSLSYAVGVRGTLVVDIGLVLAIAGFVLSQRALHRRRREPR